MATFYLDYEGGNDANDGTSFANRWKTITNGATAARIAPGDTIRIMKSPDPTSIGSATWTGGGRQAAVNIASSTNATPIVITTSADHGLTAGDYVSIASHTTNTNANGIWKVGTVSSSTVFQILQIDGTNTTGNGVGGASGNSTKVTNCIVKLASPVTKNIALCGGLGQKPAWTASTNVTTSQNTTIYREGYSSASIAIAAGFTTGLAAYYTLPATLDLSSYQQVSFNFLQSSGTIGAAGSVYLALCTDTAGATVAHTCNIPLIAALNTWQSLTVNLGTNLNSAIKSVAFYVVTDNGAQTFLIDNIVACKSTTSADSLSLTSLISKSSGSGTEGWYPIQSINYDTVMLSTRTAELSTSTSTVGYDGTTETVTSYKLETIKTTFAATAGEQVAVINNSGTSGSQIVFSGGWDTTNMSTQNGQTWFDGQNNYGVALYCLQNYVTFDRLNLCRYYLAIQIGTSFTVRSLGCNINSMYTCSIFQNSPLYCDNLYVGSLWNTGSYNTIIISGYGIYIENMYVISLGNQVSYSNLHYAYIGNLEIRNHSLQPSITASPYLTINRLIVTNMGKQSATSIGFGCASPNIVINGGSTSGNAFGISATAPVYLNNFTINETNEISTSSTFPIYSNRHDNTDGNNWVFQRMGTVNQQTSVVDSPATTSWKLSPTNSTNSSYAPVILKIATIVCNANSLVTVTARMRRDNTGLTMRLICLGGQIAGVSSDVYADMTASANTWETVTITFTPTKAGGVSIYAEAFGGTTYNGYVSNITATQA